MAKTTEHNHDDAQKSAGPAVAEPQRDTKPKRLPPYNVVLLDDNDHTYDYVIGMLRKLFGHSEQKAYKMAKEVDTSGRVIVLTTTKEHAELKRDQIRAFGADPLMRESHTSMAALIEPALD